MAGRKPKPTALKELQGNPGKRALNVREPKPTGKAICPSWLTDDAKREWRRIAKVLHEIGLLTKVDQAVMAAYCQSYAQWKEAEERMSEPEMKAVIRTTNGNFMINPWLSVARQAKLDMLKFAVEFGMTPSARSRLSTDGNDKPETLAEQLFRVVSEAKDEVHG